MATINLTTNYANYKYTGSAYGTATGYGATETAADNAARIAAVSAGNNASLSWSLNGTGTGSYLGYKLNSKTVTTSKERSQQLTSQWESIYSYSVSQDNLFYQVHLSFDVSGLTASNIGTATLNVANGSGQNFNAYVCAPASSSVNIGTNQYYHYDNSVFSSNRKEFTINSNSVNVDITDQLKQCINTEKGILVITGKIKNPPTGDYQFTPSFSLTYTNSITACTAPTSISDNGTGYIISGGSIKLKWSGAQGGTNNPINGYRIYWKQDSSPTTSSYTGYYDLNSTDQSCTFSSATNGTFPNYNNRGKTFYFKICTKGTNNQYSSISTVQTSIKFNQLPATPTVSVDHRRFKSTGGSVTFTVTPGADGDTNQTKNVYWSTSESGSKTKITGNTFTTPILNNQTAFLFWTYDGYEYSSNYDTKTITQNTAPTLGDVTLNINNSTNLFNDFNIDGFCASESCDSNGSIVSRKWELYLNGGETIVISGANTLSGFSNFNIVSNSHIAFGQIYRIRYTITDDIGESVTAASTPRAFPTPSVSLYDKNDTGITDKFGKEIYLKYNQIGSYTAPYNFNGVEFYYKLSSSSNWIKLGNLNTTINDFNNKEEIDCSTLSSNSAYNLKVKYTLSNGSSTEIDLGTKTRSIALNPIITTPGTCYPFQVPSGETNTNSFTFNYQDNGFSRQTKTFKCYIGTEQISSYYTLNFSDLQGTISLDLPNTPTSIWQNYIGNGSTLNDSYSKELKIEIIDEFGDIYTDIKSWTFDFSNSLLSGASASVQIKATDDNYYDFSNDYPLFESQILKVEISDLKSYCDETVTLILTDNVGTEYSTSTLNLSDSGGTSNRPVYTNSNANFTFVMPKIITNNKNNSYFILEIKNGSNKQSKFISIQENNKFVISRCDTNAIDLQIIKVEKSVNGYDFTCQVTDFGGYGTEPCKDNYSSIGLNIYYSADGNQYTKLNQTPEEIISSIQNDSFTITVSSSTLPGEKIYFKPEIIVTNNFNKVDSNTKTPSGITTYTKEYINTTYYIYYSSIPNLAYGKNFFLINTTDVGSCTNQALIIRPISGRNILYFGEDRYEATIIMNSNSVILDNFVINGGTWDQS